MSDDAVAGTSSATRAEPTRPRRSRAQVIAPLVGNALEYFDWLIYTSLATVIAVEFFPPGNPTAALLSALGVFAVGFLFRPLGGLVLSAYADRRGRRAGMVLTMVLMAGGALLIGVTPSYAQIGILAPIVLLLGRTLQGFSTGAEITTAATYMSEVAPQGRRGLFTSLINSSSGVGTLGATLAVLVLRSTLTPEQLQAWGWRIPFLLGSLIGVAALVLRYRLEETEAFVEVRAKGTRVKRPVVEAFKRHPGAVVAMFALNACPAVYFYTFVGYVPTYVQSQGLAASAALTASLIAQVVYIVLIPVVGALSDRIGRRRFILAHGVFVLLVSVPLFSLLSPTFASVLTTLLIAFVVLSFFSGTALAAMPEQFPTEVRVAGLGVPYSLTAAVFGGTAPLLLTWLSSLGWSSAFAWYVAALGLIAALSIISIRDRQHVDLRNV